MATFLATALQDEMLDELVWRVLGAGSGTVEAVLLLNAGVAASTHLAEGQQILLPVATERTATVDLVQLWD